MILSRSLRAGVLALLWTALAACDSSAPSATSADAFPSRPVRIIVPFGAGGLADVTLRIASEGLSERTGEAFVIENRPGAGGVAATTAMLNAPADGHSLIVLTNGTAIAETLFAPLPYDIAEELTPVSLLTLFDLVLLADPESGVDDIDALLALARERPGGIRIATINPGSTQNLSAELFKARTGIEADVIAYRTSPDVLGALLRGEVDLGIEAYTALKGAIDAGQLRPLAVTGAARNPALPNVPTAAEAGVSDYVVVGWNALYARSDTPPETLAILNALVVEVAAAPDVVSAFADLGVEAHGSTPEEAGERLRDDIARWREAIDGAEIPAP